MTYFDNFLGFKLLGSGWGADDESMMIKDNGVDDDSNDSNNDVNDDVDT